MLYNVFRLVWHVVPRSTRIRSRQMWDMIGVLYRLPKFDLIRHPIRSWLIVLQVVRFKNVAFADDEPVVCFTCSSPHRWTYTFVPKSASTTILHLLLLVAGRVCGPNEQAWNVATNLTPTKPRLASLRDRSHRRTDAFVFTFVRNPYARAYSAYKDRVVRLINQRQDSAFDWVNAGLLVPMRAFFHIAPHRHEDWIPTFEQYLLYISKRGLACQDGHHLPQHLCALHGLIEYDFIGRVENYEVDMRYVLDQIGAPAEAYKYLGKQENVSENRLRLREVYTPKMADMLYRYCRKDFEFYGYDRAIPDT